MIDILMMIDIIWLVGWFIVTCFAIKKGWFSSVRDQIDIFMIVVKLGLWPFWAWNKQHWT